MKIVNFPKLVFKVVEMTPEFAQELLDKNHPRNRKPKAGRIEQYTRDMRAGIWKLTHQPIAVCEDGYLIDGQNRLSAVVRYGEPVMMVLCTGVPREGILGADSGAVRNVADAAQVIGKPLPHGALGYSSVARSMMIGLSPNRGTSVPETLAFIEEHKLALQFAFEVLPKNVRGLTQASVRAVIARAYYKRNCRSRIREFGEVYMSGLPNNVKEDVGAIRLRNFILEAISPRRGAHRPNAKIVYAKAATALRHFIDRNPVESLRETSEELFPLHTDEEPEEVQEAEAAAVS